MIRLISFYNSYKSIINGAIVLVALASLATCVMKRQYNKGVSDGKVAVRIEGVNQTTKEVRQNIKEAVVIVTNKLDGRVAELDRLEKENVLPELTDPVLIEKYENPEMGISDEMFFAINKARAETER